ncbi:MAG TPA: M48 family metallopeptidase [Gemmataceae bacterium]|jgi:Zn-dependent protease with chaperone function
MAWLRCPHCATFLPNTNAVEDDLCGCPACGGVFATKTVQTLSPVEPAAPHPSPVAANGLDAFYPPGPRDVPADLTTPSPSYRRGVVLLLVTLTLFFGLYLGLLIGSGCLIFWSLRWLGLCFGLPVAFVALIVFLYLLKGFFKSEREGKSAQVEILETDHPLLFAFIRRLCDEVGAPAPHRVFLSPEVNAMAFYERSLLGLLRPTPKNLLLGLGLVNVLTLSEFKAVLAHEFGHFAQSSMKLGTYVYTVNRVLLDVVAGRDWLDNVLLHLRAQPNAARLFGNICWGVIAGLRYALTGLFYGINFLDKSLSRQMEFHADLMAVRASGSEPIVRALARMDFANEALEAAAVDLKLAADHDHYSRDLFVHQRDAIEHLRRQRQDPRLGEPPPLTADPLLAPEVFDPEDGPPRMWADHPSNYDREQNAKRRYVPCPLDDRPAWLLFEDATESRERVTWRFYRFYLKIPRDTVLEETEAIQAFLNEERRAVTYDPRYHGLYDDRFIEPGDLNDLVAVGGHNIPPPPALRQRHAALYGEKLAERAAAHRRHLEERNRLLTYRRERAQGKKEPLEFRGRRYRPGEIKDLLKFLDDQLTKDQRVLAEDDCEVFLVHFQMSRQLGGTAPAALRQRYTFHLELQRLLGNLLGGQNLMESALAFLSEQGEGVLPAETFYELKQSFRRVRDMLHATLEAADELRLPPLPHLKDGARLGSLLWDRPLVGRLGESGQSISGKKIQKLCGQLGEVIERARHLHFKSLGGILTLQEEIARRWLVQFGGTRAAAIREQRE